MASAVEWAEAWPLQLTLIDESPEQQSAVWLNGGRDPAGAVLMTRAVTVLGCINKVYFMGNPTFRHVMY